MKNKVDAAESRNLEMQAKVDEANNETMKLKDETDELKIELQEAQNNMTLMATRIAQLEQANGGGGGSGGGVQSAQKVSWMAGGKMGRGVDVQVVTSIRDR